MNILDGGFHIIKMALSDIIDEIQYFFKELMIRMDDEKYIREMKKKPVIAFVNLYHYIPKFKRNLPYHRRIYIV